MSIGEKTAIVCSGGGMTSAHGGGFLYALGTKLGITHPDIIIGSSGDAGNIAYFSTGQYENIRRIWEDELSTPRFISPLRLWRLMDIDYLIDVVFKKTERLDTKKLQESTIRWFVPITDFETGHTRYVSADDHIDAFEMLRASAAIPILFGKKVLIQGRLYTDGEFGPVLQDHISQALRQGAKRIVVITHTTPWTHASRAVLQAYAAHTPEGMRDAIIRDISTDVFKMTAPGADVLTFVPRNLSAHFATRNRDKLQQTFERGVDDALTHAEELRTLFS